MTDDEQTANEGETTDKVAFNAEQQEVFNRELAKTKKKAQADADARIAELETKYRKEAERAKMDEASRLKAESDEALSDATKRAEEAERQIVLLKAEKELVKAGLDAEFAPYVIGADEDETRANIGRLDKLVNRRVSSMYAERVGQGAPDAPKSVTDTANTRLERMRVSAGLKPK